MLMAAASPGVPLLGLGDMAELGNVGDPVAGEPMPSLNLERGAGLSQDRGVRRAY